MKIKYTKRGFGRIDFKDRYDIECSIQESSLATEDAIWFGCNSHNAQVLIPGKGWVKFDLPEESVCTTRMHLTQEQVAELLPYLQRFVETGEIDEE